MADGPVEGISFVVTGKDIWDKLDKIEKEIQGIPEEVRELRRDVDSLKIWRATLTGALVLLGALVGYGLLNLGHLGG